jgi:PRTRC genetic system protein B
MIDVNYSAKEANLEKKESTLTIPLFSLVFYGKDSSHNFSGVTKHPINNGIIGKGKYVNIDTVKEIFSGEETNELTLRNPKIIAENSKFIAWTTPAKKADMWFRCATNDPIRLHVNWTSLLFVANKRGLLNIYALSSNKTPDLDTVVYHAPLMNIGSNGSVCQGTAKLPKTIDNNALAEIESTIYSSFFTHVNHDHTLKGASKKNSKCSTPQQLKFWKAKAKSGDKVFAKELVKFKTVRDIFSNLAYV